MSTAALYQQMDQAIIRIAKDNQNNHSLAEKIARSPRAARTIKNLEAAITTFASPNPIMGYDMSSYATDASDAHLSRIKPQFKSCTWKTSIQNKRKIANWVRKSNNLCSHVIY